MRTLAGFGVNVPLQWRAAACAQWAALAPYTRSHRGSWPLLLCAPTRRTPSVAGDGAPAGLRIACRLAAPRAHKSSWLRPAHECGAHAGWIRRTQAGGLGIAFRLIRLVALPAI